MKEDKKFGESFINRLEELAGVKTGAGENARGEDRAALAALRRGLGREAGANWESYPIVMRYVRRDAKRTEENAFFTVAALFGLYPSASWRRSEDDKRPTNLGASLAILKNKNPDSDSIERRFVALLNADAEDLPTHLRHAVSLIKASDTPILIDWIKLLGHLRSWNSPDRWVQRDWSRAFWSAETTNADDENLTEEKSEN